MRQAAEEIGSLSVIVERLNAGRRLVASETCARSSNSQQLDVEGFGRTRQVSRIVTPPLTEAINPEDTTAERTSSRVQLVTLLPEAILEIL